MAKLLWNRGVSVLHIFDRFEDENWNLFNPRFVCEGWCESNSLIVRSRETGVAIMLWDKDNKQEIWCHISKDMANTLYKLNELKNEEISNYI